MLCGPSVKAAVEKVQTPGLTRVPVPSDCVPSKKVTVPLETPPLARPAVTVAVKVVDCWKTLGLATRSTSTR